MTVDGYIACNIYRGGVTSERFKEFIETDVLSLCTPFPGPRSIIIMDNAAIHNVCSCYTLLIDYRMSKHQLRLLGVNSDDCLPTPRILILLNYLFQLLRSRLGKASRASSALYNSVRAEPYRAEIPKLGPKPSRGPARLCPSQSLTSLRTARLVKLVQLGKM